MKSIFDAKTVADVMKWLKEERNYSNAQLAEQIGKMGETTVWRLLNGETPEPATLDRIAAYAHAPREWLYGLAYNLQERPAYSRAALAMVGIIESLPEDIQEMFLVQLRAVADRRKRLEKSLNQPE